MSDNDRIEQTITIAAPAARVWDLVTEPGWFINDGALAPNHLDRQGDLTMVHHDVHGVFAIRTVSLDPLRYAAFRWYLSPDRLDGGSTLVEFTIEDATPSGVTLTVVETGFASLPEDAAARRVRYEQHDSGWRSQFALARAALETLDADVDR